MLAQLVQSMSIMELIQLRDLLLNLELWEEVCSCFLWSVVGTPKLLLLMSSSKVSPYWIFQQMSYWYTKGRLVSRIFMRMFADTLTGTTAGALLTCPEEEGKVFFSTPKIVIFHSSWYLKSHMYCFWWVHASLPTFPVPNTKSMSVSNAFIFLFSNASNISTLQNKSCNTQDYVFWQSSVWVMLSCRNPGLSV